MGVTDHIAGQCVIFDHLISNYYLNKYNIVGGDSSIVLLFTRYFQVYTCHCQCSFIKKLTT